VRGPVLQVGISGENDVTWDGRDGSGRRVSSGSYVLTVTAAGQEFRSAVMCGR
jgi:flagellar hook assembly protein FlgD